MKTPSLLILAAGLGSRYGGDKQVAAVGPAGETLLAFTLRDALRAGISAVVAVVRPQVAARVEEILAGVPGIRATLVEQSITQPLPGLSTPDRVRPWGTAHAVACALPAADGPVAVVNADDWYGPTAISRLVALLAAGNQAALVAHRLGRTLSPKGPVNRGVCAVTEGKLVAITETTGLIAEGDRVRHPGGLLPTDTPVSLNLWGIGPKAGEALLRQVDRRLRAAAKDPVAEVWLPTIMEDWLAAGERIAVDVCEEDWCGLTYADDLPAVRARLARAVAEGWYPPGQKAQS